MSEVFFATTDRVGCEKHLEQDASHIPHDDFVIKKKKKKGKRTIASS